MQHEMAIVDSNGWLDLFDTVACGSDVARRKPRPDSILKALAPLDGPADEQCWYVGDGTTDVIAAKRAGVTAMFYDGAGWDRVWLDRIFP